jgi:lysophospholipase L1-like esterase
MTNQERLQANNEAIEEIKQTLASKMVMPAADYATIEDLENAVKDKATITYVDTKVADLVNSAPETLDTLGEVATALQNNSNVVDALNGAIGNKVDKVTGKGLSSNDYTTEEKNKLSGLSNYNDTELRGLINNKADKTAIPTKVSQLTNDSNYLTSIPSEYVTETELNNKGYATTSQLANKVDKVDGKGLSTNDYTTAEKTKLAGLSNYDDTAIKSQINSKASIADMTAYINEHKDELKGEQGEKGDKGDTGSNYVLTDTDKTEIANETKSLIPLDEYVKSVNNTLPDKNGNVTITVTAEQPEFVVKDTMEEALEWVKTEGDTSKKYVLPDGYIYAFAETVIKGETIPNFTNLMDKPDSYIKPGERYSMSGGGFTKNGATNDCAIVIPISETAGAFTVRVKEATIAGANYHTSAYFGTNNQTFSGSNSNEKFAYSDDGKGTVTFTQKVYNGGYKYFVVHVANNVDKDNLIVTLNEEITYTKAEDVITHAWCNTGISFVSNDYGDKIAEIEETLDSHNDRIDNLERNQVNGFSLEHNSCSIFRKVVCCGDSFTAGYIGTNNDNISQTNWGYSWPSFMERLTGNEYVNCGHSGKDVLTWQTSAKGLPRAKTAGKAQAYLIGLGLNDATLVTLGTASDIGTENQTYYGGLSKIIRELNAISPTAKIFVQTIPSDYVVYMNYSQAVRDVVNAYKDTYPVHLLDLYEYKSLYKTSKLSGDAIMGHYTAIGYQQFAENLRYIWSEYINNNISEFQDVYLIPYDETPTDLDT